MIGVSVSDILKLLDQIPIWKTVSALPKRVAELEAKVAALETKPATPSKPLCPLCDAPMKVIEVRNPRSGVMTNAGIKEHVLTCTGEDCGHRETRLFDPNGRLGPLKG